MPEELNKLKFDIISEVTNKKLMCGIKRYGFFVSLILTLDENNIVYPDCFCNSKEASINGIVGGLLKEDFLIRENGLLKLNIELIYSKPTRNITNRKKKARKKKQWRKKKSKYYDYLVSPEWQKVRDAVHKRDVVCINCSKDKHLQVHHKNYRYFKDELNHLDSVVLLCGNCHQRVHGLNGKKKIKLKSIFKGKNSILRKRQKQSNDSYV